MIDDVKLSVFSNAIVEYLRDRLQLSSTGNQLVSMIVLNSIVWINHNTDNDTIKRYLGIITQPRYLVLIVLAIVSYTNKDTIRAMISSRFDKKNDQCVDIMMTHADHADDEFIIIDVSNIPRYIMAVYRYISLNPTMFNTNVDTRYVMYVEDNMVPLYNKQMHFDDHEHGIKGFITTRYSSSIVKDQVVHNYGMHINIDKHSKALTDSNVHIDYINMIMKYLERESKYGSQVQLYYYKILHNRLIKTTYYDADVSTWKKDVQLLQDTFFSEHKEMLFNVINHKIAGTNIIEAQAWNNLLLHSKQGGLGKSSVIYRVATMLKKNVISVDIAQYINKKNDLYAIFHGQKFKLPAGGDTEYDIDNYIIVLEEFDHAIQKLGYIDQFNKIKYQLTQKNVENKQHEMENAAKELLDEDQDEDPKEVPNSEPKKDDGDIMKSIMDREMGIASKSAPKLSLRKQYASNISSINNDMQDMINMNNDPNSQNIVYLGDLLELFQGPIHIVGRMIIATTNNFEDIKSALPMLVRPGRLTPLKFDYLSWTIFNDLVKYYLGTMPEYQPYEITIPTSQIIELAIKHKNAKTNRPIEFVQEVHTLCDNSTRI